MFNFKKILLITSFLVASGFTNVNGYVSNFDVLRYQTYAEQNAKDNNYRDLQKKKIENEIEKIKSGIEKINKNISSVEEKIQDKKKEQESLDYDYAMCVAKKDLSTTKREQESITKQMKNLKSKIDAVIKKINNLNIQLDRLKSKLGRQQAQLYGLECKLDNMQ